jgi:site-specific recombinase XerD
MAAGTLHVQHGKGDRDRWLALGDGVLAVLQLWLAERKRLGQGGNGKPVFCTLKGGALSGNQVRQMLKRRAARAGIEKRVHPHALRHSYAAGRVAAGTPVNVVQQALGHTSLATTDAYLRHIAPAEVIAMGRADDWTDEAQGR